MSDVRHTKWPWEITDECCDYKFSVVRRGNGTKDLQVDNEPDARLIAAAPELLEALKDALCSLEISGQSDYVTSRVRAAIAKATGGAA